MLEIRDATASARDLRLLREMSFLAINWRDRHLDSADAAAVDVMLARPELRVYVVGWPRPGDRAVVAEQHGTPVGAAWYRLFTETAHGYGFVDTETPELGVAVRASARGGGVGSALLSALIDHARADGHAAISLSVERDNPAAALYRRLGFVVAGGDDDAWTMILRVGDLHQLPHAW